MLVIAALLAGSPHGAIGREPTRCVRIDEQASSDDRLRPTAIIACPYGADELGNRLLALLDRTTLPPTIEAVERQLSLPRLQTAFDAVRSANYGVQLKGPGGSWHVQLSFDEDFFPTDAIARPRFRGSGRSVLINPRVRGELRLNVDWLGPSDVLAAAPCAVSVGRLDRQLRRSGWRRSNLVRMTSHGLPPPGVDYERGRALAGGDHGATDCLTRLRLNIEADARAQ